jgi:bifunctional non-homologous end joining protein LigD
MADERWTWEQKFDGVRCLAVREAGAVRLRSRTGQDLTSQFPHIAGTLAGGPDTVYDGEIVAIHPTLTGRSFQALQRRAIDRVDTVYHVFDILWRADQSTTHWSWTERRRLLEDVFLETRGVLELVRSTTDGVILWRDAIDLDWEGLIGKPVNSAYRPGQRGPWVKVKPMRRMRATVVGWTSGEGARDGALGALILAEPHPDPSRGLRYLGKVGTGFTRADAVTLARFFQAPSFLTEDPPLDRGERARARVHLSGDVVHWVRPLMQAEIAYQEHTADGSLRFPSFKGWWTP